MSDNESLHFVSSIDLQGLRADVAKIEQSLKGITATAGSEAKKLDDTYSNLTKMVAGYFTVAFGAQLANSIVEVRGQFQQLDIAFTTMLGSKEKAAKLMEQTVTLAAKTPYSLLEIAQVEKGLIAFGEDASTVADTMTRLGNIASGTGANIGELGAAYGKVMSKGKMQAEELNQFTERGVPIVAELAKMYGITSGEVYKLVEQGKVGFPELQQVIKNVTSEGAMFYNLMEKQSATLTGKISNLGDAIDNMYNDMAAGNDGIIGDSIDGLTSLVHNYETVLKILESMVVAYGAYKTAVVISSVTLRSMTIAENLHFLAIVAKDKVLKAVTITQNLFNKAAMMNPYGMILGALVAVTGALLIFGKHTKTATELQNEATGFTEDYAKKLVDQRAELEKNIAVASDNNKSLNERNSALKKVKDASSGYLNSLTLENLKTSEGTTLLKNYNDELERKIRSDALADKKTAIFKEKANLEIHNDKLKSGIVAVPANQMQEISNNQNKLALKINESLIAGLDTQIAKLDEIDSRLSGKKPDENKVPQSIVEIDKKIKELKDAQQLSTTNREFESFEAKIAKLEAKKESITGKKANKEAIKTELDTLKEELDAKKESYDGDLVAYKQYLDEKEALLFGTNKEDQLKAVHDAQKDNDKEIASNLKELTKKYASFEQQKNGIADRYAKERLTLINAGKTEEIAQLDKAEKEEQKTLNANHVKETASYQYLFENIDKLSVSALQKRIERLKQDLAVSAVTAEEKLAIEKALAESSEALVSKAPLAALKELEIRARDLRSKINAAKTDAEKAPLQAELDGVTQKQGEALSTVFSNVSSRLGEAKELAGMFGEELGRTVEFAANIAGSFAKIASGDYVAGAISLLTTVMSYATGSDDRRAKKREKERAERIEKYNSDLEYANSLYQSQVDLLERLVGLDKQRQLEKNKEQVGENMQSAYADLNKNTIKDNRTKESYYADAVNRARGKKSYRYDNYSLDNVNTLANQALSGNVADFEKAQAEIDKIRKDIHDGIVVGDTAAVEKYLASVEEGLKRNEEIIRAQQEALTGSTYDSMVDAIATGFEDGTYTAEEFTKNFEDLMKKAILNALKIKWIEGPMKSWNAKFAEYMKDGKLTDEEAADLKKDMQDIKDNAAAGLEAINQAGIDLLGDAGSKAEGLSGAIKGMSQDSADLMAGQLGAMRIHLADIATAVTGAFNADLKDAWKTPANVLGGGIVTMNDNLVLMRDTAFKANEYLAQIEVNTRKLGNIEALLGGSTTTPPKPNGYDKGFREDRISGR